MIFYGAFLLDCLQKPLIRIRLNVWVCVEAVDATLPQKTACMIALDLFVCVTA